MIKHIKYNTNTNQPKEYFMKKLVLVSTTTISLLMACGAGGNKGNMKSGCSDCAKTEKPMQMKQRGIKKALHY
jgi:hypothetical protein